MWLRKILLLSHQLLLMKRSKKKKKKLFKFPKKRKPSRRPLNIKKLLYKRMFLNRKMLLNKKRLLNTKQEKCGASVREDEKCGKRKWKKRWLNLSMLGLKLCCLISLKKWKTSFKTSKKSQLNLLKKKVSIIKLSATCVAQILF